MKIKDLSGKEFGRLTVIERGTKTKRNATSWKCQCICGEICEVNAQELIRGDTISCGCYRSERAKGRRKRPFEYLYNKLVYSASYRKIPIDLTYEDYFLLVTNNKVCHYCDAILEFKEFTVLYKSLAHYVDRKDNSIGYSKNNCVLCCTRCNRAKSDHFTYEEFVKIGEVIKTFAR